MTRRKKLLLVLPYFLMIAVTAWCWTLFMADSYSPFWQHWVTLALVVLNGVLYLRRLKTAIVFTGIVLLTAIAGLSAFSPEISWIVLAPHSDGGGLSIPVMGLKALLLLVSYAIFDGGYVVDLHLARKEAKAALRKTEPAKKDI